MKRIAVTVSLGAGFTHHSFVVTGNDLAGGIGDAGLMPGATYWFEDVTQTARGSEVDYNSGKCYSVTIPAAPSS